MALTDVLDYWHETSRRARRQTLFTGVLVVALVVLVAASFVR